MCDESEDDLGLEPRQIQAVQAIAPLLGRKITAIDFDDATNILSITVETGARLVIEGDTNDFGLPRLWVDSKESGR